MLRKLLVTTGKLCVLLCVCSNAFTQVCTGALGDYTYLNTFGSGANPGLPLPPGYTPLTYTNKDCPSTNEYTIWNFTFRCFNDDWVTVAADHTSGDQNGYYLMANADGPTNFYRETITNLCAGSTYEFSFWLINLSRLNACEGRAQAPDITCIVEDMAGNQLATVNTGAMQQFNQPQWQEYKVLFTAPSNSIVIKFKTNTASGCGNDFLLDDIGLRPCGPTLNATISGGSSGITICEGQTGSLLLSCAAGAGFQNPFFQWQESTSENGFIWTNIPGANSLTYTRNPTANGIYSYRVIAAEAAQFNTSSCRISSNAINVFVEKLPFAQGTNYSYCFGQDAVLFSSGGVSYSWTGPNNFTSSLQSPVIPQVQFNDSGLYVVTVTSANGCSSKDSTNLFVIDNPIAFAAGDTAVCEGTPVPLTASGGDSYLWLPAAGIANSQAANTTAVLSKSTRLTVKVTKKGCSDTASVAITVFKNPVANAGPDKKMLVNQKVTLNGTADGTAIRYQWIPDEFMQNALSLNPVVAPPADKRYTLRVVSDKGCPTAIDNVIVKVYERLIIPNAFSPNNDGINDTWVIEPLELYNDARIDVFNRYGQLVYQTRGAYTPWNGKRNGVVLPSGTYYYLINLGNGVAVQKGALTILR